jgi:glycerophosphoryl diester phosphodiesterase
MASFRQAVKDGADAFELDVALTRDGEFAVIHDDTVDRTTNGSGTVGEMTLAELKRLDAGSWFSEKFGDETVPELGEVLDWARGRSRVVIETKRSTAAREEVVDDLLHAVRSRGMENEVAMISFNREFVEAVEERAPEIDTGVLIPPYSALRGTGVGAVAGLMSGLTAGVFAGLSGLGVVGAGVAGTLFGALAGKKIGSGAARKVVRETTADNVAPHWYITDRKLCKIAAKENKGVVPWVINSKVLGWRARRLGADGLITDRPAEMKRS